MANWHFWLGTLGILFYAIPMYWAGFMQSLMWKEFTEEGMLKYPNFLETVNEIIPLYAARSLGGALYLAGVIIMTINLIKTVSRGYLLKNEAAEAPALKDVAIPAHKEHWHRWIERRPVQLMVGSLIVILIGGIIEMVPTFLIESNIPTISSVKPYTPLELEGRDIYVREGCNNCHSQMIRPFRSETARYGEYSKAGEFVYDHPFLWGSKRTGPDLHRIGNKYPDSWHYNHMLDPVSMSPGSIMPAYPWLFERNFDKETMPSKIKAMKTLGVPYPEGYELVAVKDMEKQGKEIGDRLKKDGAEVSPDAEIVALIAYLQRMGTDIQVKTQSK
jgi:cytochrome c oxidase cbb3-type subunit I/II